MIDHMGTTVSDREDSKLFYTDILAINAASRAAVDAFFATGLAAGGIENGAPGFRAHDQANYYAAVVLDRDGYNIEAVCHG